MRPVDPLVALFVILFGALWLSTSIQELAEEFGAEGPLRTYKENPISRIYESIQG